MPHDIQTGMNAETQFPMLSGDPQVSLLIAPPDAVRRQLERVLASPWFTQSDRMRRFLRFAVEHALAGTGDKVKEYLVGMEVFDRRDDFDPQVDPIVRVEARRLRAKLKANYESIGRDDALRIECPKGSYAAIFRSQ